ncbi:EcsC protein family protein [Evansella caseinilytica]|uniref:EcsC protein family protein n=1 Tax=Evansella caseinilytica TaxID=1503961 RepID=A0A1H3TX78_9BACI|nr:EcsC family protein [Evansella caseinilytica]SDZ54843.1 EcsC protein family protein [Evansella caseinilytica]
MPWTTREQWIWQEITAMEKQLLSAKATDFSHTYQKGIELGLEALGGKWTKKLLAGIDDFLFHLQAVIQQGYLEERTREMLLTQARVFRPDVHVIADMKKLTMDQLRFIAKKQLAKQRLTALAQGGLTGIGGILFMLGDLPLLFAVNLRTVQLMALTYGYDLRKPYEMMFVLKVFYAVSLPPYLRQQAWERLFGELEAAGEEEDFFFYDGKEEGASAAWLQRPINHLVKLFLIAAVRKKRIQGIPVISLAAAAGSNYYFARQISEAAHLFYQKRLLLEKR